VVGTAVVTDGAALELGVVADVVLVASLPLSEPQAASGAAAMVAVSPISADHRRQSRRAPVAVGGWVEVRSVVAIGRGPAFSELV